MEASPMNTMEVGEDPYTLRMRLDGTAISTYTLMMLIVPIRLLCRRANKSGFWWDDWLAILSLLWANGLFYVIMICIRPHLGFHVNEVGMENVVTFLKAFLAAQLFYVVAIATIKFSILMFYWRLFSVAGRIPILTVISIVFVWVTVLIFLVIFQCKPTEAQWIPTIANRHCMDVKAIYSGGSIPNIITDLILIVMPLPYIWKLHIRVAQRIVLAAVFMVGCFVLIVSIIRFRIMMGLDINDPDITYNMYEIVVWSVVEVNIGLVCACLPSLRPAFTFLRLDRLFSQSKGTDKDSSRQTPSYGERSRARKKGSSGGLFSTVPGLTRMEDDDDGFQMIDNASGANTHGRNGTVWGKSNIDIEAVRSSGEDTDDGSKRATHARPDAITVQTDWSVRVDERKCRSQTERH